MTHFKPIAGVAMIVALAGTSALAAHAAGAIVCQTWNPAKTGRAVTHCASWRREDAERMRAAGCDPKTMTDAQMRARCAELMAGAQGNTRHLPG